MRCANCGADLPVGAMFCGECGTAVYPNDAVAPATAHEQTPDDETGADQSVTRVVDLSEEQRRWLPEAAAPVVAASSEASGPPSTFPDEATRMPDRVKPAPVRFALHFSTGESITVEGTGLIGRRPAPQPGEYFDALITIDDPGRSVSKTHLEFGQEGGVFWVSDRFSANGTIVREPDRQPRLCAAGMRARVPRGSRVDIGEQFFVVA